MVPIIPVVALPVRRAHMNRGHCLVLFILLCCIPALAQMIGNYCTLINEDGIIIVEAIIH